MPIKQGTTSSQRSRPLIFFRRSNGGQSQGPHRSIAYGNQDRTVCGPNINIADVDTVLEGLVATCFYLQWDRNRYRFGLSPNLNHMLVTRRGGVQNKAIEERIGEQTEKLFRKNSTDACKFIEREFFPRRSNDVKEIPKITLVAMSLEHPAEERATLQLMEEIVRDAGTSGRTFKSALLFAAPDPAENIRDKAREVLAWEDIDDDEQTRNRIDEGQLNLLERSLKAEPEAILTKTIFRAYQHLYLLGKDNKLRRQCPARQYHVQRVGGKAWSMVYFATTRKQWGARRSGRFGSRPQTAELLAGINDGVVDEGRSRRFLFVAAVAPLDQPRRGQTVNLRCRDARNRGLRDQGCQQPHLQAQQKQKEVCSTVTSKYRMTFTFSRPRMLKSCASRRDWHRLRSEVTAESYAQNWRTGVVYLYRNRPIRAADFIGRRDMVSDKGERSLRRGCSLEVATAACSS